VGGLIDHCVSPPNRGERSTPMMCSTAADVCLHADDNSQSVHCTLVCFTLGYRNVLVAYVNSRGLNARPFRRNYATFSKFLTYCLLRRT